MRPRLTIDPARQFGRVCIDGSRVPARSVVGNVRGGDPIDAVADDYRVSRDEVLWAVAWSHRWADRRTRAGKWVVHAFAVLGGWEAGPLEDPPPMEGARWSDDS